MISFPNWDEGYGGTPKGNPQNIQRGGKLPQQTSNKPTGGADYSVTQTGGTPATGTPATGTPGTAVPGVQVPAGYQVPTGMQVVAVGPTGIPTLRAIGATNTVPTTPTTGTPQTSTGHGGVLSSIFSRLFGRGLNYQSRLAEKLNRDI